MDVTILCYVLLQSYLFALALIVCDHGLGELVEGLQPFLDGLLVVVDASGGLTTLQQSLLHHVVRQLEVQHHVARTHLGRQGTAVDGGRALLRRTRQATSPWVIASRYGSGTIVDIANQIRG